MMKTNKKNSLFHSFLLVIMCLLCIGQMILINRVNWVGVSHTLVFTISCDITSMVCLTIFYLGLPSNLMNNEKMRYLIYLLCIVFFSIQIDILQKIFQGRPDYRIHVYACSLLSHFMTGTSSLFFYLFTRKAVNAKRNFGTPLAVFWWLVSFGLYVSNIWHNLFFTVDANAYFQQTFLGIVEYFLFPMIVQISAIICMYKFDTKKETRIIFYGFNIIPLFFSLLFRSIFGVDVLYVGVALAIMICYSVFFSDLQNETSNIKKTFGKFFSQDTLDKLIDQANGKLITPSKKTITLITVSIRNYNTISQNLDANELVDMINHFFEVLSGVVEKNSGVIVNYWGYGFSVYYEHSKEGENIAEKALYCAIKLQNSVFGINIWNRSHSYPEIEIGVGIHTSELVLGPFGSISQSFYKAIGPEASYSFELEEKSVQDEVLISSATKDQIKCELTYKLISTNDNDKLHGFDIYSIYSMGAPHNLTLDHYHASMVHLEKPYHISFKQLSGNLLSDEIYHGYITDISKNKIYLKTSDPFSEIDIENAEHSCFYAKYTSSDANHAVYHYIRKPLAFDKWYNNIIATNPIKKKEKMF